MPTNTFTRSSDSSDSTWVKEVLYFEEILKDTQIQIASNFLKQEIKLYPEKIGFQEILENEDATAKKPRERRQESQDRKK